MSTRNQIYELNEAEGIFYAAFDKHICDDGQAVIDQGSKDRLWDSLAFTGGERFCIRWRGEAAIGEYDTFLGFISFPKDASVSGKAVVDGREISLFQGIRGEAAPVELRGSLSADGGSADMGDKVERKSLSTIDFLTIEPALLYESAEDAAKGAADIVDKYERLLTDIILEFESSLEQTAVTVSWFGLEKSRKRECWKSRVPVWQPGWDIQIAEGQAGKLLNNLMLTQTEGEALKKLVREDKRLWDFFTENGEKAMDIKVDEVLGEYAPVAPHMYRFVRERDRGRRVLEGPVLNLAIAGYLLENPSYSRQAARLILALTAMKWFEGPVCEMKGSKFHHVCFTEDHLMTEVCLAAGFLGGVLSKEAFELINGKIEESFWFVRSKCLEPGYRNFMNQGIVGNRGALLGAVYLQQQKGGFEEMIEESYRRHSAIIDSYLTENGHCAEGGNYFEYSFTTSVLLWHVYSRYTGRNLDQVVPDRVRRSGRYMEAIMSVTQRGGRRMPLNCGSGRDFSTLLLVFMTLVCDFPQGNNYLASRFSGDGMEQVENSLDLLVYLIFKEQLILQPEYVPVCEEISFREEGLLSFRKGSSKLVFTAERNPYTAHFHEDRGGVILEAEGEILLPDLGTTSYANPMCLLMEKKEYHNLACPGDLPMKAASETGKSAAADAAYPITEELHIKDMEVEQARIISGYEQQGEYVFSADTGMLFGEGITGIRQGRFRDQELCLTDCWEFSDEHPVSITFLSYSPWKIAADGREAASGRMTLSVDSEHKCSFELEQGMVDWEEKAVYVLRIHSEKSKRHVVKSCIRWSRKEFLPENTGRENTIALQAMLDAGGTVRVEKPGIYQVEDTLLIGSNTALIFGAGVYLKRSASSIGSFALANRGAFTRSYDENITIQGLSLITGGVEARLNAGVYGLTGELSFFYVRRLQIFDFTCMDLPRLSFGIHVCTFEDLCIERIWVEGRKDAVHLGKGSRFVIRHGRFRTFDDPIALNAHDYAVANPQMGWIENGLIEDCYDLADQDTTGYFCRILAGAWCSWYQGMEIQNSDTVVSGGRVYRAFQKPDGVKYCSLTAPVHKSGMKTLDGIHWVMVQEEVTYQCGCRNIHFKDIHLQKEREVALSIHFDHDQYSRSVYPGAVMPVQENLVFENLITENKIKYLVRSITPVDVVKVVNSVINESGILLQTLPGEEGKYGLTRILMNGNTCLGKDSAISIECQEGRECMLKAADCLTEQEGKIITKGAVKIC